MIEILILNLIKQVTTLGKALTLLMSVFFSVRNYDEKTIILALSLTACFILLIVHGREKAQPNGQTKAYKEENKHLIFLAVATYIPLMIWNVVRDFI